MPQSRIWCLCGDSCLDVCFHSTKTPVSSVVSFTRVLTPMSSSSRSSHSRDSTSWSCHPTDQYQDRSQLCSRCGPHVPTISALQALEGGVGCLRLGSRRELSALALGPGMPLIWAGLSLSFGHSVPLRMFCFYSEIKVFPFQHILPLHVPLSGFSL